MRKHSHILTALIIVISVAVSSAWLFSTPAPDIMAATCPFIDNDGNDADATVGVYELNTNFNVAAAATAYDCTSAAGITTFKIPDTRTLTLQSNTATGEIAQMNFTDLLVLSGGTVNANGLGCAVNTGPNSSNVCGTGAGFQGYGGQNSPFGGGGGHGGAGGAGNNGLATAGAAYDSATAPVHFGAGAGLTGGGAGGGIVRLNVSGTLTHDGVITASGNSGTLSNAGGGAGGSISISVGTLAGTSGTWRATGGNATNANGGGGSGGRIAITYATSTFGFNDADFVVTGGTGFAAGSKGSVYVQDTTNNDVSIFHGFTWTDTDYNVNSWTFDASATAQNCLSGLAGSATPSLTSATAITFNGTLLCAPTATITSFTFTSPGFTAETSSSMTIKGPIVINPGSGSVTLNSGSTIAANVSGTAGGALTVTSPNAFTAGDSVTLKSYGAMSVSATTTFLVGTGATVRNDLANTDVTFAVPAGQDQTWDAMTLTGAREGDFIVSNALAITLTGATSIASNVQWTALTALDVGSSSSINANGKGCAANTGPNGSNVCGTGVGFQGYGGQNSPFGGGGGHGGAGGAGNNGLATAGTIFDSSTAPVRFGSGGGIASGTSGIGGGAIRINVTGTVTHNGSITANGNSGTASNGGGGSGGSIYITSSAFTTTAGTPTFTATGGNGVAGQGGGGGGGRIAVTYATNTFGFDSTDFTVTGGTGFAAGGKGTVYLNDTANNDVRIFHGFTFINATYAVRDWIVDSSATAQICDPSISSLATPFISATRHINLRGTFLCAPSISSFTFSAGGDLTTDTGTTIDSNSDLSFTGTSHVSLASSLVLNATKKGATVTLNIPNDDDQTLTNQTFNVTAEAKVVINGAFELTLVNTDINGNVTFSGLTGLTIDANSSINATAKGCVAPTSASINGSGPNGSNVCTVTTAGYGKFAGFSTQGAGHGGTGGRSASDATVSATYGSATAPVLFGSSAGTTGRNPGPLPGYGGGAVRINVTGTFTLDGSVLADGGAGQGNFTADQQYAGGGGSGGSIYVTVGTMAGATGTFSAKGGNGGVSTSASGRGGGGGGGRVALTYATATLPISSSTFIVSGGTATSAGVAGTKGTVYVQDTTNNDVTLYHGFTYTDTDHSVRHWTVDPSTTNQQCGLQTAANNYIGDLTTGATPSVTATGNIALDGTLNCQPSIASFVFNAAGTMSVAASASQTFNTALTMTGGTSVSIGPGATISSSKTNADMNLNIPAGNNQTWTGVTIANGPEGDIVIDDAIAITLTGNSHVNANVQWTSLTDLTIDSGSDINATSKGCQQPSISSQQNGYGPNGSNVCVQSQSGSGFGTWGSNAGEGAGHGGRGGRSHGTAATNATYGSPTTPSLYGSSAGTTGRSPSPLSGPGGGYVRLNVSGTLTINGSVLANGGAGQGNFTADQTYAGGAGSGGSIHVTVSTLAGSTGTFNANGGNGGVSSGTTGKGGGGGGGRIALTYATSSFSLDADDFSVAGGTASAGATVGNKGTVYVKDSTNNDVTLYHGFTWTDTDHSVRHWTVDPSTTNQQCGLQTTANGYLGDLISGATPSVVASGSITLAGTMTCSPSIASFVFNAAGTMSVAASASQTFNTALTMTGGTGFSIGSGASVSGTKVNADMNLNIPSGNNQTWTGVTISNGPEGDIVIDDAVAITLTGNSHVNGNVQWTALTDLTIDSGSDINATGKGCQPLTAAQQNGFGPNGSNVCTQTTAGYGKSTSAFSTQGAGHGGTGGRSASDSTMSPTYGSPTAPGLYGSSAGTTGRNPGPFGGTGGGYVRINVTGTFTLDGSILADGGAGQGNFTADQAYAGGGGSGGSVYITTGTIAGSTGVINSKGGNGGVSSGSTGKGGGGGGGRVALTYATATMPISASTFDVGGGTATSAGVAGTKGTVYVKDNTNNDVTLYHGFTWTDTDHSVRHWTVDPSTTNQQCGLQTAANNYIGDLTTGATPSVTATGNIALDGTLNCQPSIASFVFNAAGTMSVAASASQTFNTALTLTGGTGFSIGSGASVSGTKVNADMNLNIPAGNDQTWTGVTLANGPEGDIVIDDAVAITLTGNSHINANVQWTALTDLTINSGSDINATSKGCQPLTAAQQNGFGPNGSNVCTQTTAGYGKSTSAFSTQGAGHGGAGGRSASDATASATYGSSTAPVLYGSSAGTTGRNPGPFAGAGGGYVRIVISGTLTVDGSILANGGAGQGNFTVDQNYAGGGGSGGSIYITTGVISGSTGVINSKGGNGGVSTNSSGKGGGGGGGRISINYTTHSTSGTFLMDAAADTIGGAGAATQATGGTATSAGVAGTSGTLSMTETGNPVPATTSISPDTKTAGDVGFTLTVNGSNFIASSVVRFNGSDRTTVFVNSGQLTATIDAVDIATGGSYPITVFNPTPGGGTSNAQTLTVNNPVPTTTSISPTTKDRFSETFILTVNGTNFTTTSIVRFAGSDRTTTFVSSVQITASIPASDLTTAGTFTITVFNPTPAGGASNGQTFTVVTASATSANKVTLSRLKAGATSTIDIAFVLENTLSSPLTVTFPAGFTVLSAATGGSACLSGFGFTSSTLTATKTNCTGPIIMTGATVQNPAAPGGYFISWVNDDPGGAMVFITSDDQTQVSASITPTITFNVGSQAAATACDGSFSGNGGSVPLGALTLGSVSTSDAASVPHICARLTTDASSGAAVSVRSANGALASVSAPTDTIASSTATLTSGTAGYGLCAGSAGGDAGKTDPAGGPASASPVRTAPFNGSCSAGSHAVGGLTTSFQNIWTVASPSLNAFARIYVKASISPSTPAHADYTDTLTFIVTGTY